MSTYEWSGTRFRAARVAAGITQEALAREINVSVSTVARWERGTRPAVELCAAVADVLGVRTEDLVVARRRMHRPTLAAGGGK